MAEGADLGCTVVCDTAAGIAMLELALPGLATVADALQMARAQLSQADIDWDHARVGVWGRECLRDRPVAEGDRIEVYRPLPNDPKVARRQRAHRERRRS